MLKVENVSCQILKNVDLEVREGEIVSLLGSSGCGKTTTLNVIAGFLETTTGSVHYNDLDWKKVPTQKRNIGVVFQDYALYNNKTVLQNIIVPIRKEKDRVERAKSIAEKVGLTDRLNQNVETLSGGQKQRVAIARAIVKNPSILLLDESFSALDAKLRVSTREWVRQLIKDLNIPTLLVTHDQEEAFSMSDYIYVMKDGKIEQYGRPNDLYSEPKNTWVAKFIGDTNIFRTPGGFIGVKPKDLLTDGSGKHEFGEVEIVNIDDLGGHYLIRLSNDMHISTTKKFVGRTVKLSSNRITRFDDQGDRILNSAMDLQIIHQIEGSIASEELDEAEL